MQVPSQTNVQIDFTVKYSCHVQFYCNNMHLCSTHTCTRLWVRASKSVCVSADINHFGTAAVCRSIYPQISRLKSPSNHHVASQRSPPGRLSSLSRFCVRVCVCDSMCLPLCLRECASVQNA